jgi:hypothetical protein
VVLTFLSRVALLPLLFSVAGCGPQPASAATTFRIPDRDVEQFARRAIAGDAGAADWLHLDAAERGDVVQARAWLNLSIQNGGTLGSLDDVAGRLTEMKTYCAAVRAEYLLNRALALPMPSEFAGSEAKWEMGRRAVIEHLQAIREQKSLLKPESCREVANDLLVGGAKSRK